VLLSDAYTWILPRGLPPLIKGDHQLLGADFNTNVLFGNKPATHALGLLRGMNSNHDQHVQKFCKEAISQCNKHLLSDRITQLMEKQHLLPTDIQELESIDTMITKILVLANRHCHSFSNIPWSLAVQHAFIKHQYWTLCLVAHRNEHDLQSSLDALATCLQLEDTLQDPHKSLSAHLKQAQKQLKEAHAVKPHKFSKNTLMKF